MQLKTHDSNKQNYKLCIFLLVYANFAWALNSLILWVSCTHSSTSSQTGAFAAFLLFVTDCFTVMGSTRALLAKGNSHLLSAIKSCSMVLFCRKRLILFFSNRCIPCFKWKNKWIVLQEFCFCSQWCNLIKKDVTKFGRVGSPFAQFHTQITVLIGPSRSICLSLRQLIFELYVDLRRVCIQLDIYLVFSPWILGTNAFMLLLGFCSSFRLDCRFYCNQQPANRIEEHYLHIKVLLVSSST